MHRMSYKQHNVCTVKHVFIHSVPAYPYPEETQFRGYTAGQDSGR